MSSLHLSSYNAVCWRSGRLGGVDVVAPLLLTKPEAALPSASALDGVAAPVALTCVKQPKQELTVWLSRKGHRNFRKAPKLFHSVAQVCVDGAHLGIFYTQHRGTDLSFALVEYDTGDVERLVGPPKVYATEVSALMSDVVSDAERKARRTNTSREAYFTVSHAILRYTARGFVVAAVVVTNSGGVYGIAGDLSANVWRKWKMGSAVGDGSGLCVFVPFSGAEVRFMRCDIETPVDPDAVVVAPSMSLALSAFDRVPDCDVGDGATASSSSSRVVFAVLRECVLPTRSGRPVTERCYQSHAYCRSREEMKDDGEEVEEDAGQGARKLSRHCLVVVEDKSLPVYTIVVPGLRSSYVVYASYAAGGGELVASAAAVPELRQPISVCSFRVPAHPQRPNGTTFSLVLCRDLKLYACEHFGQPAEVVLHINNLRSSAVTFPSPLQLKPTRKPPHVAGGMNAATAYTRLVAVYDGTEVVCTNGVVGVFFRVSAASLQTAAPAIAPSALADPAERGAAVTEENSGEDGASALHRCLAKLEELSLSTTRHELPDIVFREVLPRLRYVGTSQQEVMLMQRVYEQLLHMVGPNLQSEWDYLWALTSALQRTLVKRNRENGVCYTDAFFLQLADTYCHSAFASAAGTAAVQDAVRTAVSHEVARMTAAQPVRLPPEVRYVLDGLAEGVSPINLAEEVARRMVQTSTLLNGACVVSAQAGKAECVHGVGCVLLASCLDLTVVVCVQEGREMRVCMPPPSTEGLENDTATAASCVAVPPYTFRTQEEFEKALTLAADMLCVSTADASFRPDVAMLTLAIGNRRHCLIAFVQLFAPILRSAVESVAPLANSAAWIEACTATLSRSFEEQAAALLSEERSSGASLSTTLSYVLYAPRQTLNAEFFGALASTLPEEFCTTALVACIFHETERLVAATHNYAAAVATFMLSKTETERESSWQAAQVGRRRLSFALARSYKLWASVGKLSPYQLQDIAASYRMSARNSLGNAAAAATSRGTVVSRTLVACFRLLCLVQFCCDGEDVVAGQGVESCAAAVQTLYLVREAPLPLEWFQRRFVSHVSSAATQQPSSAPYLVRVLQLSNVRQTGNAGLKKEYYKILDTLQSRSAELSTSEDTAGRREELQRAISALESAVTALTLLDEVADRRHCVGGSADGGPPAAAPPSPSATVHFAFTPSQDTSLPRWTLPHALPERRFLFSQEWTDVLWTLERAPEALLAACERTVRRISQTSVPMQGDEETPTALSAEMANPLFAHLCRLRPPVRMHTVPMGATAASPVPSPEPSVVQRQPRPADGPAAATRAESPAPQPGAAAATPAKLQAPQDAAPPSSSPPPTPTPMQMVAGQATASAAVPPSAPLSLSSQVLETPNRTAQRGGMYAPADVAWWDAIGQPVLTAASRAPPPASKNSPTAAAAVNTATGDDNGESSDSATSYTTSTSNYADPIAAPDEFARGTERPCRRERKAGARLNNSDSNSSSSGVAGDGFGRGVSARSPLLRRSDSVKGKGKCRCCHRALRRRDRSRGCCRRTREAKEREDLLDGGAFSLRWRDGAVERVVSPLRPPPTRSADTARPTLLSFTTRLLPPEEPSRMFAQTARAPSRCPSSPSNAAAAGGLSPSHVALLRLPATSSASRELARVRLYTLHGDRAEAAEGGDVVSLHQAEAAAGTLGVLSGRAAPLTAPTVPPSRVFVAPPALLRLPQRDGGGRVDAEAATGPAPSQAVFVSTETSQPYAQVARAPEGPAPPAVDLSTLHYSAVQEAPQPQANRTSPPTPGVAVMSAPAPPAASANLTSLPLPPPVAVPVPSLAVAGLPPSQMAEFRRYTDDLVARQAAPTVDNGAASTAAAVAAAVTTPPLPGTPPPVPSNVAVNASMDGPGVARLVQQQEDFIRKAETLLQTRQAENEGFYRRVVESLRSLTAASQGLRGLTPVEQSQLVRDTVKQRNDLMSLNHQLLEMQLAAARVSGEAPPSPAPLPPPPPSQQSPGSVSLSTPVGASAVTAQTTQTTQTLAATSRTSVGVSWAAPAAVAATPSLTSVPTQTPTAPKADMQETLSDLQRLNTELMGVSASAGAMEKAIKETREAIQRYERGKAADALTAEGVALTAAMRLRTAAVEQRLSELSRLTPQSMQTAPASRGWTVQPSSPVEPEERSTGASPLSAATAAARRDALTGATPTARTTTTSTAAAAAAAPPQFTAQAEMVVGVSDGAASTAVPSMEQRQTAPTPTPLSPSLAAVVAGAPLTPQLPPPLPASPPTFTSVSSSPLAPTPASSPVVDASPSVSFAQTPSPAAVSPPPSQRLEVRRTRDHDENVRAPSAAPTQARVHSKPSDLHTLFIEAGGAAHTPPMRRPASLASTPAVVTRPKAIPATAGLPAGSGKDRYAMYRMPAKQPKPVAPPAAVPSSCLPLSYPHNGGELVGAMVSTSTPARTDASASAVRRGSAGDVYADRQRDRRMINIARRVQQLEHDLFD